MKKHRKKTHKRCKFIEEEADLSGSGHSEDDDLSDEEELEKQKLFVDDEEIVDAPEDPYSPVHDSERDVDSDDMALIAENNESEEDVVVVRRRHRAVLESSSDEYDSMDDFIVDDEVPAKPVAIPAVKAKQSVLERAKPAKPTKQPRKQQSAGRRPVKLMASYSSFCGPSAPEPQSKPAYSWDFLKQTQQTAAPKKHQAGYVRSADGLKYRRHDGSLVRATGVDSM